MCANVRMEEMRINTLVANFKLVKVSVKCACIGLAMTNMRVLELPPSEYWSKWVNLELRYGMWLPSLPCPSAAITSPKQLKLLLMFCVSFFRSPSAPDDLSLSEPAKSTKLRVPSEVSPVVLLWPISLSMKTEWEREDRSLDFVAATRRLESACLRMNSTVSTEVMGTVLIPVTSVCFFWSSWRISCFFFSESLELDRRSLISSL